MMKFYPKKPSILFQVGIAVFVLAEVSRRFFGLGAVGASDLSDAGLGFLMGISIALMLLSIVIRKRNSAC